MIKFYAAPFDFYAIAYVDIKSTDYSNIKSNAKRTDIFSIFVDWNTEVTVNIREESIALKAY